MLSSVPRTAWAVSWGVRSGLAYVRCMASHTVCALLFSALCTLLSHLRVNVVFFVHLDGLLQCISSSSSYLLHTAVHRLAVHLAVCGQADRRLHLPPFKASAFHNTKLYAPMCI